MRATQLIWPLLCVLFLASCTSAERTLSDSDRAKLKITLQRTACLGDCPDYDVTIHGDGRVVFRTQPSLEIRDAAVVHREYAESSGVRVPGRHETVISHEAVDRLVAAFRAANFFELSPEYRADITDMPTFIVSIEIGARRHSVVDYGGTSAGMPTVVKALEDAIDEAAGTERWIEGTPQVIPLLQAEGATFDGRLGLALMDAAAERGDIATLTRIKDLGAPIFLEQGPNPLVTSVRARRSAAARWLIANGAVAGRRQWRDAISTAVELDNHTAFALLYSAERRHWIDREFASKLLTDAALNADPRLVQTMLQLGADPDGVTEPNYIPSPPLFQAANGVGRGPSYHSAADRRSVVRTLLSAGANIQFCPEGFNDYCESPLFLVSDPVIATMLIDSGADVNFKNSEGDHIFFNINTESVALVLIAHGADLTAVRTGDGMTVRRWAVYNRWPQVTALIDRARRRQPPR